MEVQAESRSQLRRLESNDRWEDNRPNLVLISGKAGVGKTTLAGFLSDIVHGTEPHKTVVLLQSIAWGVKQTAMNMGWNHEKDIKGRRLLQGIGKIGREHNPDTWVEIASKAITDTHYHYGSFKDRHLRYIWIDDWRFKNEARWFREMDYLFNTTLINIVAPSREILAGSPEALDVSETDLDDFTDFDIIIDNEGTIDELREHAQLIYNIINNVED